MILLNRRKIIEIFDFLDEENILTGNKAEAFSHDIFSQRAVAAAVLIPKTKNDILEIVKKANDFSLEVHLRGGGVSYTEAYLPTTENSVILDMTHLNKIEEINGSSHLRV